MFLHYAFDAWMAREFPNIQFERYCDDIVVHVSSESQAQQLRAAVTGRLAECGLEVNEAKTRIVYCKDADRRGSYEHRQFDFLGYTFRPRSAMSKSGHLFVGFSPAVSNEASKRIRREMRRWRLHLRVSTTLTELARTVNPILRGWINYYGRFYRSALFSTFRRLNKTLVRWAMRKYKRLSRRWKMASKFLVGVARRQPGLFAHWQFGIHPDGWTMGAR
jgi:hypothetical protein